MASLDGRVKGQRRGDREVGPCFRGLYPGHGDAAVPVGHGDEVSVSPYFNHSTELKGEESCGTFPCAMLPWRGSGKPPSTFTRRNHWVKGDNSFFGLFAADLLVWFSPFLTCSVHLCS